MITLLALLLLWASYGLAHILRDRKKVARTLVSSTSITSVPTVIDDDIRWSALDDHQLTRLLTQASPASTTPAESVPEER